MGHITAPNSLLRNCRFVEHKLNTILCRCLTGPLQDQWNNKALWASLSTVSFLSPLELLPRCHTKCVENTHPSTVPGKLLGRSHLWLYTQLKMYIILFMISSSKRILACKIQSFKDFSFIGHHLLAFIPFISQDILFRKWISVWFYLATCGNWNFQPA